jgi:hypothetical protein
MRDGSSIEEGSWLNGVERNGKRYASLKTAL